MNKLIAVTIGDINGIGIELLVKLFINKQLKNIVLFSDFKIISKYLKRNNIKLKLNHYNKDIKKLSFNTKCLNIFSFKSVSLVDNTLKSIKFAHSECFNKKFVGIVTLPIRKDLIIKKIMPKFIGHTEYLQNLENKKNSNMILYHNKIIISPITTHIRISSLRKKISQKNFLFNQIINLNNTLKKDFKIYKPKIILSGFNPHSGENGNIGDEEIKIIKPTINKLLKRHILIEGPFSADSIIQKNNINKYDCFVFIFHDQALIPFKYISKFSGVNYTGNLDVIRTSPDHGTAYELRGTNKVSNLSLKNCFKLINLISKNRKDYEKSKKITKSKFYNR